MNVQLSVEEMLQNTPVQRLKGGNPTVGLPRDRLVTRTREINITFKQQYKDSSIAGLMNNWSKRTVK
jgi:hypothetical protein